MQWEFERIYGQVVLKIHYCIKQIMIMNKRVSIREKFKEFDEKCVCEGCLMQVYVSFLNVDLNDMKYSNTILQSAFN